VNSNVTLVGVIDSPDAVIYVDPHSAVFGAVVGKQVTLNGADVHFDQVLAGVVCQ
jgi:hypothetical protein